ncbi:MULTISPECIES: ATP-binding SpoIIE family protein phosphatase [unclassified Streptomyces]|nr:MULTISPECIES: ATP-binding SpoIIE family protein phosphatase [unclassified Streptomyces]AWL38632.1 diguanylate cyclase [Streptomyces sp. SM18]
MADAPLMVVDGGGVVTGWSRAAEQRFGLSTADATGRSVTEVLARDRAPRAGGGDAGALRVEPLAGQEWAIRAAGEDHDAIGQALLDVMFTQAHVQVHLLDPELRVLRVSDPSPGRTVDERMRGRPFGEACGFEEPERVHAFVREVMDTGVPGIERLFHAHPLGVPGGRRTLSVTAFRLQEGQSARQSAHGTVLGVAVSVVDVSERVRRRRRDAALAAVRESMGRSLDVEATCRDLVDALVPEYADAGVVEVVDAVLRGETVRPGPLDRDVPLRRAAFGGRLDPAHPVGDVRPVVHGTPYQRALSDLRARVVPLDDVAWSEADPERTRILREFGAHSLLLAPMSLRGTALGLLSLYRCGDAEAFTEEDIPVAAAMASRAALGIDNARRYVHEFTVASTLQRRLLPQLPEDQPAVETHHLLLPGRASGSWFDTISLSGARTALVIGEVSERGLQAATTMGQLRTVVHALAALDLEPDELLARLYDTVARLARERAQLPASDPLHRQALAATCAYAVYDPFTETCAMASAGHPAPLVVDPDGTTGVADLPIGPPLGSTTREPVAAATFPLRQGSVLALAGGALSEHLAPPSGALRQVLAHPDRPLRELCDEAAYALPDSAELHGSVLLLARTRTMPAERYAAWELPYDTSAPATARRLTSKRLADWNLDDDTGEATELIVSEMVTNAVRYGRPPLKLRLILDRGLTCEIRDGSTIAPHMKYAGAVDEGGRGLFIVSQLATVWGTRFAPGGKTVWSEQTLPPDEA